MLGNMLDIMLGNMLGIMLVNKVSNLLICRARVLSAVCFLSKVFFLLFTI